MGDRPGPRARKDRRRPRRREAELPGSSGELLLEPGNGQSLPVRFRKFEARQTGSKRTLCVPGAAAWAALILSMGTAGLAAEGQPTVQAGSLPDTHYRNLFGE